MQIYLKRGVSGRLRVSADSIGEQYDPRHTTGTMTLLTHTNVVTKIESLNEPDLKKSEFCKSNPDPDKCANIDQQLVSGKPVADNERVFATAAKATLTEDTTTRKGDERVGALTGVKLWDNQ